MHKRIAQEQGEPCTLTPPIPAQLHHEPLRRTYRLLLLRQQAGGFAGTCGKDQTAQPFLNNFGYAYPELAFNCLIFLLSLTFFS